MALNSASLRMAVVYAAIFITYGIHLPFFPVFLAARGLDETGIAAVLAVPMALRVFTAPWLGLIGDRAADRRHALIGFTVAAAIGFGFYAGAVSLPAILAVTALTMLAFNGIMPTADTIALAVARRGQGDYGRMRAFGSAAFIVGNLAGGAILAATSPAGIYWLLAAAFWLQALASLAAPRLGREATVPPMPASGPQSMKTPAGFRDLVADRRLVLVLAGAALIQSSHAMSYGFATLYWKSQGFDATLIGVFWAVGVVAETVLFASASRFGGSAVPLLMILAGGIAAVLRWATFAVIDSTPVWTIAQLLHALSFAATYLGTIQYLARAAPERLSGRAQGLSITVNGIAMVAATLASGPLYKALGGGAFTLMSGLALAGTLLILALLRRPQPHSAGSGGCTIEPS